MKKLLILVSAIVLLIGVAFMVGVSRLFTLQAGETAQRQLQSSGSNEGYIGMFTPEIPSFPEIKGVGKIPDEVAQYAVGAAVKYNLLPSVILSQWAYEGAWGTSTPAKDDHNDFGITWFQGCPFPKGSPRGVGGSEGGYYMKFPDRKTGFSYYGYMVASQGNFNACVGKKEPSECLLILGRGGYAAAGIDIDSEYYRSCMSIITSNQLQEKYDTFAITHWQKLESNLPAGVGDISVLDEVLGQRVNNGQCYGLTAFYVEKLGGPQLMGSGKEYASEIGGDYDWASFGWTVKFYPQPNELQAGDVINWSIGGIAMSMYGHTGVIAAVSNGGEVITTYEQNAEKGEIVAKYTRTFTSAPIKSIVRKAKK